MHFHLLKLVSATLTFRSQVTWDLGCIHNLAMDPSKHFRSQVASDLGCIHNPTLMTEKLQNRGVCFLTPQSLAGSIIQLEDLGASYGRPRVLQQSFSKSKACGMMAVWAANWGYEAMECNVSPPKQGLAT